MRTFMLLLTALLLGCAVHATDWAVPACQPTIASTNCVAYNAATHKLYVGNPTDERTRRQLTVYDTDEQGRIIGQGRRYVVHSNPQPGNQLTEIVCIFLDTRHNKLFIGLTNQVYRDPVFTNPLVMFNLDAAGEPTGAPQAFNITFTCYPGITAIAQHPTLNRLYLVGQFDWGVQVIDQDANGVPTGTPTYYSIGPYTYRSIDIRADGTKCYLGGVQYTGQSWPSELLVVDMDGNGNLNTGTLRRYAGTGKTGYLIATANNRGVYYRTDDGHLAYWSLDAAGEPTPAAPTVTAMAVQNQAATPSDHLVVCVDETFTDALDATTKVSGVRVKEFALNTNGSLDALIRQSAAFDRQKVYDYAYQVITPLNVRPDTAVITSPLTGVRGNRIANLSMRTTLLSVEAGGELAPRYTSTQFSSVATYLRFAYSARWGKVYGVDNQTGTANDTIVVHTLSTGATTNIACPDPMADTTFNIAAIAVDDQQGTYGTLYVGLSNGRVDVRPLDANGVPSATPDVYNAGLTFIDVITVDPTTHYVYVVGYNGTAGQIGATNMYRVPAGYYIRDAVVNIAKHRLYVTNNYDGNTNLYVYTLNADGTVPNGATPTKYGDAVPLRTVNPPRGILGGIALNSVKNRLYFTVASENTWSDQAWLVVYRLDDNGDPVTSNDAYHRAYPIPTALQSLNELCLSTDGQWAYLAGWGDPRLFAQPLDANGDPTGTLQTWLYGDSNGKYGELRIVRDPADEYDAMLLTGAYISTLDVVSLLPDGTPEIAPTGTFTMNGQVINYGQMRAGATSGWTNLNQALRDGSGMGLGQLVFTNASVTTLHLTCGKVRFDFSLDGGTTVLASRTSDLAGNCVSVYLPRYDVNADKLACYGEYLLTSEGYMDLLRDTTLPMALSKDERPRDFLVAGCYSAGDGDPGAHDTALNLLNMMGQNTMRIPGSWLSAEDLHTVMVSNGMKRFRYEIYNPISYHTFYAFDTYPGYDPAVQEDWDAWANTFKPGIASSGAKLDDLALFHIADEPWWYFPGILNIANDPNHPERLQVFRDYLIAKGFTPAFFGKADWDQVNPIGQSQATTLENRRLFYWTTRFMAENNAEAFAKCTTGLCSQLNTDLLTETNLNNWPSRYYIPSPNAAIMNNPIVGPDTAAGAPDWFELGRKNGVSAMWTEDWFVDSLSNTWSIYGDLLRCTAREGENIEYGSYVCGPWAGQYPVEGMKYKILSLIGHGAKAMEAYTFGPYEVFADGWSTNPAVYQGYQEASRLVGKSEKVLYPGRPRNGKVAILVSTASQPWDGNQGTKLYMKEVYGLHTALTHAQYTVDFIDDTDIESGKLATYGYYTLYVTGPNLSAAAQTAIKTWVQNGGRLVLLPGAGERDEYNEPVANGIQSIMGAAWGTVARVDAANYAGWRIARTTIVVPAPYDGIIGTATDETQAQTVTLTPTTASVMATFGAGGPAAVTGATYGNGNVFAFAYWPGMTYATLVDNLSSARLPCEWQESTRKMIVFPNLYATTPKDVACTQPLVECALLESETNGIGVTLLNWNDALKTITISVNKATMPANILNKVNAAIAGGTLKVSSVEKGDLTYTVNGNNIDVALTVNTVDVLMLTW